MTGRETQEKEQQLKCIYCGSVMHRGCLKYYENIVKIDEHHIKCCDSRESGDNLNDDEPKVEGLDDSVETVVEALRSDDEDIVRLTVKNNILSVENSLLKKLISEMEEKNALLLFKIDVLERDRQSEVKLSKATPQNSNNKNYDKNETKPMSPVDTKKQHMSPA